MSNPMKKIVQALLLSLLAGSAFGAQQTLTNAPGMLTKANANFSELYSSATFDRLLKANGAIFNGTTDDSAAIQAAIDTCTYTARCSIKFPAAKTIKINSGLTIRSSQEGVDFNGDTIDASGMTSGYAISIVPNTTSPYNRFTAQLPIQNFVLLGPASESNVTDGLFIGGTGTGNVAAQVLQNFHIRGFRDGIYIGSYSFINTIFAGNVEGNYRYGVNFDAPTLGGEGFTWHGGQISSNNKGDGSAIGIKLQNNDGGNNEFNLLGVSVDYNDKAFSIDAGAVHFLGCHIEDDHFANTLGDITWSTGDQPAGVYILGGTTTITESAANSRATMFNVNGGKAYFIAKTVFPLFDHSTEIVTPTNSPQVDLRGSVIDFAGSTKFPSVSSAVNLLYNGDAETGTTLDGWSASGTNYTFTQDTSVFHGGAKAYKIVSTGTSNGSVRQYVPVTPGQRVIWKAWVNVTAISAGQAFLETRIYASNPDSTTVFQVATDDTGAWSSPTSGWVQITRTIIVPKGGKFAYINLSGTGFTGTMYLDDVEIYAF